ncbi:MAG: biotin transporter BioY [Boseongicola sp. SB0664_bin_43]|uniref:Biotin transporter n=1 Tax=Boseongicola sp. SB0664_bin_43 TaxID=2604844 RepID=A0A6B0XZP1_9RHOB|nr:biotin transporter BioY [Boseongicola sp. SB0664_bin_43]
MTTLATRPVLADTFWKTTETGIWIKRVALVVAGVLALTIAAKLKVPMWPVPITMGTFAVLAIGTAYGPALGLSTILAYLVVGAFGLDVFAGNSAGTTGLTYMMGTTGGYLVGYALAATALGWFARKGWDREIKWMALALLIGNAIIYVPGLLWLGQVVGWDKPVLAWGLWPFLIGDGLKLVLAALVIPGLWKLVGDARA